MVPKWKAYTIIAMLFVLGFAAVGAITQIDLTSQVRGVLAIVNGGTGTASTLTGLMRGSASAMTAAELSGDATTSGSNAVTVAKVNGTSVPTNAAADQAIVTTASATGSWTSLPNCGSGNQALAYSTATHTFSCQTITGANFADAETPSGTINGVNAAFTLAHTPSGTSLALYKNGQLMVAGAGADYTLSTSTVTFNSGAIPKTGDVLIADYRF